MTKNLTKIQLNKNLNFFYFCGSFIVALRDPDPDCESRSGSTTLGMNDNE
jgi:hypothetical protein